MSLIFDYNLERENNIIKNIALEIVAECTQDGLEVTPELANYMVKIKLLNPRNGFTASEVMPRSLTQQLVASVVENLKLFTPGMNCIRMQVFWNSLDLNVEHLKNQFIKTLAEKAEPYLNEVISLNVYELFKMNKLLASYTLTSHNMGSVNHHINFKQTAAAVFSVFKHKDAQAFFDLPDQKKNNRIIEIANRAAGVRLFLKYIGKGGDGIEEVKDLFAKIEGCKNDALAQDEKITAKIEDIRMVIMTVIELDFFEDVVRPGDVNLPSDCTMDEFIYLKKILTIMLQHGMYISDIISKLDEIDGTANIFYKEFDQILQKLKEIIKNREAVPTTEVYEYFDRAGQLYLEIQGYFYCLNILRGIMKKLETINKKHYFTQTKLEKILYEKMLNMQRREVQSFNDSKAFSNTIILKGFDDFTLEFNGFCAMTLFYTKGLLIPGVPEAGIFQYKDRYFAFADKRRHELWAKDPEYYLMETLEFLRENPEMIYLLNAYDNLYGIKNHIRVIKVEKRVPTRTVNTQTVLHPIEEYWDKHYTFSIWELKKRALALSRLVKCVTKSAQTFYPQSHYRASIGLLAAPDKDKEVQTKRDSSCVHSTISNYLYGLRGHREDKFRVVELTRPVEETCEKQIILEEGDPCRERRKKKINLKPCPSFWSIDKCDDYYYDDGEFSDQYTEQLLYYFVFLNNFNIIETLP